MALFSLGRTQALGVGIGYRDVWQSEVFQQRHAVDFLEITADHFFDATSDRTRQLDLLASHFTLIPHGLDLSLGSAEGVEGGYLRKLADLVNKLDPPWWSEHLAFTRAGGMEIGHLAPLAWTGEAVDVVSRNIEVVRQLIDAPLLLENITYPHKLPGSELSEGAFLTAICERCDCGVLLDVTNLYTNSVNHGFDAAAALDDWPIERVVQLHFAGGEWHDQVLIDSHAAAPPSEVWALLGEVVARAPVKAIALERDENVPPLADILPDLAKARNAGRTYGRWA